MRSIFPARANSPSGVSRRYMLKQRRKVLGPVDRAAGKKKKA
jgi:hypothetical protein